MNIEFLDFLYEQKHLIKTELNRLIESRGNILVQETADEVVNVREANINRTKQALENNVATIKKYIDTHTTPRI
jgi:hydrogenase maturation factor